MHRTQGCIPIVFGAPNLADYFPHNKSMIHIRDYATMAVSSGGSDVIVEVLYTVLVQRNRGALPGLVIWRSAVAISMFPGIRGD